VDLADAMRQFRERHPRSSNRQEAIQRFCCSELEKRGLEGAEIEINLPGAYRVKKWDVGLIEEGKPRLGISCKSIVSNHGGTVPNRVDDMLGEAVNLHRAFPQAVLGYLFMMSRVDESQATQKKTKALGGMSQERLAQLREDGDAWFERLVESVSKAAGRKGPRGRPEMFEAVSCSQVDFTIQPYAVLVHGGALSPDDFFDRLVELYRDRFG
jgi:Restriction endonuclease XhoI